MRNTVDIEWLAETALNALEHAEIVEGVGAYDVASGYAGYALSCIHLARISAARSSRALARTFRELSYDQLKRAVGAWNSAEARRRGLYDGFGGLAVTMSAYEREFESGSSRSASLTEYLAEEIEILIRDISSSERYLQEQYDVISGLAGLVIAYNISSNSTGLSHPLAKKLTEITSGWSTFEEFTITQDNAYSEHLASEYPQGYIDCGVAHGIFGTVPTLLASAERNKRAILPPVDVHHLVELALALGEHTVWLRRPGTDEQNATVQSDVITTMCGSWCYGELSRLLVLLRIAEAGDADRILQRLRYLLESGSLHDAGETMERSGQFGLCHGLSGFLVSLVRLAQVFDETNDSMMREAATTEAAWVADKLMTGTCVYRDLGNTDARYAGYLNGVMGTVSALTLWTSQCSAKELNYLLMYGGNAK